MLESFANLFKGEKEPNLNEELGRVNNRISATERFLEERKEYFKELRDKGGDDLRSYEDNNLIDRKERELNELKNRKKELEQKIAELGA